jgi:hypothetical protein
MNKSLIIGKKRQSEKVEEQNPATAAFHSFTFSLLDLFLRCGPEALPKVQAAVSGGPRTLSQLPRTLCLGPGKLCESRLPGSDDPAAAYTDQLLAILLFRRGLSIMRRN